MSITKIHTRLKKLISGSSEQASPLSADLLPGNQEVGNENQPDFADLVKQELITQLSDQPIATKPKSQTKSRDHRREDHPSESSEEIGRFEPDESTLKQRVDENSRSKEDEQPRAQESSDLKPEKTATADVEKEDKGETVLNPETSNEDTFSTAEEKIDPAPSDAAVIPDKEIKKPETKESEQLLAETLLTEAVNLNESRIENQPNNDSQDSISEHSPTIEQLDVATQVFQAAKDSDPVEAEADLEQQVGSELETDILVEADALGDETKDSLQSDKALEEAEFQIDLETTPENQGLESEDSSSEVTLGPNEIQSDSLNLEELEQEVVEENAYDLATVDKQDASHNPKSKTSENDNQTERSTNQEELTNEKKETWIDNNSQAFSEDSSDFSESPNQTKTESKAPSSYQGPDSLSQNSILQQVTGSTHSSTSSVIAPKPNALLEQTGEVASKTPSSPSTQLDASSSSSGNTTTLFELSRQEPSSARTKNLRTPGRVYSQVMERIKEVVKQTQEKRLNENSISLRLDPPELGGIKIELSLQNSTMHARFVTDSAEALQIIRERGQDLQQLLRKSGLNLADATVSFFSKGGETHDQHQTGQFQQNLSQGSEGDQWRRKLPWQTSQVVQGFDRSAPRTDQWIA